jgi:hypothetical protein
MKAVNNTDLNISLDRDLVDFVMAGSKRWHGERIRKSLSFFILNLQD